MTVTEDNIECARDMVVRRVYIDEVAYALQIRDRPFTSNQEVKEACMRGSLLSRKPSFRRASGSLCNVGPSALKSKGTMLKNYVNVRGLC